MRLSVPFALVLLMALTVGCAAEPAAAPNPAPAGPSAVPGAGASAGTSAGTSAGAPDVIKLPAGFPPEGIAVAGSTAYLGDRENGAIYRVDLATGRGAQLAPPTGRGVQGMKERHGRLYAAGRSAGDARVIDANTGRQLASLPLVPSPTEDDTLVNDVLLTKDAWWLTESRGGTLYRVALPADGALPTPADVKAIPLTGDFTRQRGINANGIAPTPDGTALLIVQSNSGTLFRVDPDTGRASAVDLGGERLEDGDGMLLDGRTLFVAQNGSNALAVVELDEAGTRGRLTRRVTDPRFDAPTTLATWGDRLYLPNARFDEDPGPSVEYDVVSLPRPR